MSMMTHELLVQHPNLQVKILNWFDKLSAMIHIQLLIKLYLTLLSLSHGTIERIIHDCLKMKKVTSRWVSHQPTDDQKQRRVKLCHENLMKFHSGFRRLCDIITGDETWI